MKRKFLLLGLCLLSGLFFGFQTQAVEDSTSILMDSIPANPAPLEDTTLTLKSFAEHLDSASISWFVDGKNVASGIGKKSISVQAPAAGVEMSVLAKISLPDGETQVRTVIKPAEMVLLWQATDSHVPPFYKGKALPAPDSFVKVVAMPEIKTGSTLVDPKNMVYAWQKDYENAPDGSGYGRNFFTFRNDYLEDSNNIGVTASTTDGKYSSVSRIQIGMASPNISFYRKDAERGTIWETALGENYRIEDNDTIAAVPYFISPKDIRRPDLVFNWFINDVPVGAANFKKNLIPLQVEEGTSGISELRLEIESTDKIFQTARKTINVEF